MPQNRNITGELMAQMAQNPTKKASEQARNRQEVNKPNTLLQKKASEQVNNKPSWDLRAWRVQGVGVQFVQTTTKKGACITGR